MKYSLLILGAWLAYKLGKETAWEEIREAMGADEDGNFVDTQRNVAGQQ